jgi:hypothetical protein
MDIGGNVLDSRYFTGLIDDFRVWNVARTAAEIQADMNRVLSGTEAASSSSGDSMKHGHGDGQLRRAGASFNGTFAPEPRRSSRPGPRPPR